MLMQNACKQLNKSFDLSSFCCVTSFDDVDQESYMKCVAWSRSEFH